MSWNETDAITRLPIFAGEKVVAFVVCMDDFLWQSMSGKPYLACYKGTYNDRGSLYEYENKAEEKNMTEELTDNYSIGWTINNEQVHVKQYKQTIFIKESVFNDVINFVDTELLDEWKRIELYAKESVYNDLFFKNYEFLDSKEPDLFKTKKDNIILIVQKYLSEELKNLESFCKLILFCEKTRIDLRNAVYGKGHNYDMVKEYKFLKKLLNKEFDNYISEYGRFQNEM